MKQKLKRRNPWFVLFTLNEKCTDEQLIKFSNKIAKENPDALFCENIFSIKTYPAFLQSQN